MNCNCSAQSETLADEAVRTDLRCEHPIGTADFHGFTKGICEGTEQIGLIYDKIRSCR